MRFLVRLMRFREDFTLVVDVPSFVVAKPGFGFHEHGKMARVDGPCQRILCHAFRNDWVELDHTKFRPTQVFVRMEKSRLLFRSARTLRT